MIKLFLILLLLSTNVFSQKKESGKKKKIEKTVVEAACGKCQFGMQGSACELAIRMDGKTYWVDGSKIDDHGEAHAEDGLCSAIRRAEVSGIMVKGRFRATSFRVLSAAEAK